MCLHVALCVIAALTPILLYVWTEQDLPLPFVNFRYFWLAISVLLATPQCKDRLLSEEIWQIVNFFIIILPISDRVGRVSTTETVDSGSIRGGIKSKTIKKRFSQLPCVRFSSNKEQCEASTECGEQVGRWQLDSKTARSFRCHLAKATCWINSSYIYNLQNVEIHA